MNGSITIGPEFFDKVIHDYSDWKWALIREFLQNSIDAKSSTITIEQDGLNLTVSDDGSGMTEQIIREKFLVLGASGKNFEGTVGGFGRARELLCFMHDCYSVRTQNLAVDGTGGSYSIETTPDYHHGTTVSIAFRSSYLSIDAKKQADQFVAYLDWSGTIICGGVPISQRLKRGTLKKTLDWCKIYTTNQKAALGKVVVRANGIPMFVKETKSRLGVIIELTKPSHELLNSNRDNLKWRFSRELDDFILTISTNSAVLCSDPVVTVYVGQQTRLRLAAKAAARPPARPQITTESVGLGGESPARPQTKESTGTTREMTSNRRSVPDIESSSLEFDFYIRNEIGKKIPEWYLPTGFSKYSRKLATAWLAMLVEISKILGRSQKFSVGFVFSNSCEAFCSTSSEHTTYYIKPANINWNENAKATLLSNKFKLGSDFYQILSDAIHEFVHGEGYDDHGEEFAGRLTDVNAIVMANLSQIRKAVREALKEFDA